MISTVDVVRDIGCCRCGACLPDRDAVFASPVAIVDHAPTQGRVALRAPTDLRDDSYGCTAWLPRTLHVLWAIGVGPERVYRVCDVVVLPVVAVCQLVHSRVRRLGLSVIACDAQEAGR